MSIKIFLCSHHYYRYDGILLTLYLVLKNYIDINQKVRVVTSNENWILFNKYLPQGLIFSDFDFFFTDKSQNHNCSKEIFNYLNEGNDINLIIFYLSDRIKPGILNIIKQLNLNKCIEVYLINFKFNYLFHKLELKLNIFDNIEQIKMIVNQFDKKQISIKKWDFDKYEISNQEFVSKLTIFFNGK